MSLLRLKRSLLEKVLKVAVDVTTDGMRKKFAHFAANRETQAAYIKALSELSTSHAMIG